tara:strand:+ start:203 stop:478 length:276 start_codon:yes stop_codon:yes gene_type:complete
MSKLVSVGNEWYNIRIFGQKVNWATFVVSGLAFVTFEVIRRKMIQKQIEEQVAIGVQQGIAQYEANKGTIIDQVIAGVDELDFEEVLDDIT